MRAGTIVASNYLEMARLLAESFLDQHPGDTFTILVVDDLPVGELGGTSADGDAGHEFDIVRLGDLDLTAAEVDMMKTIYDVMELSTAVKPSFLKLLLRTDPICAYLDPDIFVYAPFGDLLAPVDTAGIVLTPHVLEPIPRDGTHPNERMVMGSGIFNLGFIAVGRSAVPFLDWWQERLLVDAVSDIEANLFTDQRWIDWVPAIFGCVVCREPGMNVAWWNIHERELTVADESVAALPSRHGDMTDGAVLANGSPLRFVHFSGYDPALPDKLSKHQDKPRTPHAEGSVIRSLAERYGAALQANGHQERRRTPYQWNTTAAGRELPAFVRAACRSALLSGERTGTEAGQLDESAPMAFGATADGFEAWLAETIVESDHARFSRVEVGLYKSRPDLQAAFAKIDGVDAEGFRAWLDNDSSVPGVLGDRWNPPAIVESLVEDAAVVGGAAPMKTLARRAAGKARRELTPYVERARGKVGR